MKDIENLPTLRIRGVIAPKDSLLMGGESFSASDMQKFLDDHKEDQSLVVEISSNGGYRAEGVEIYQIMKASGKDITTIAYKANSIATVIMLGGTTRLIAEYANFVVHFARIDPIDLGVEALTADDFLRLAEETERADSQILNIYCAELGEEKRTELVAAMADERDLGAKGAIKLGFATGFYKKKKKEKMSLDFPGLCINEHLASIIQNQMSKEKEESKLEKLIQNFSGFLAKAIGKIKNEVMLTLADGTTQISITAVDPEAPENLVGAKVNSVVDGLDSGEAVADGEYTLEDGRTLVVAAGVVSEVRDAIDAKKLQEDLKAKEEALAAKDVEIQNLKTQMEADKVEMKKQFDAIQNAFKEFKEAVPGDKKDKKDKDDEPKVDLSKMSVSERFIYNRREQIRAEKKTV